MNFDPTLACVCVCVSAGEALLEVAVVGGEKFVHNEL